MVHHFAITLTDNTPVKLSTGSLAPGNAIRFLSIQADAANAAVVYVGGNTATLSSTDYGFVIPIPFQTVPAAPSIIELSTATFGLGSIYVLGSTGEKVHVLVITS